MAKKSYEWKLPKGMYSAARNNIIEMMVAPLTPLYRTLGISEVNRSFKELWKKYFDNFDVMPKVLIFTVNQYAYYNGSLTPLNIVKVLFKSPTLLRTMFKDPFKRWDEIDRPKYIKLVSEKGNLDISKRSSKELFNDVRVLTKAAVDAYGSIVSGIIPGAWISEGIFTIIYNFLLKGKNGPIATTYLMGYDTLPIKSEKALYDLSKWVSKDKILKKYVIKTSAKELSTLLKYPLTPKDLKESSWNNWKRKVSEYLDTYGHRIYSLDFANSTPSDDPTDIFESLKMYVNGKGVDPHKRQKTLEQKRIKAVADMNSKLNGLKARIFTRLINSAQRYAPARENGIADVGLGYPQLRRMLLEISERLIKSKSLNEPSDIFWLLDDELSESVGILDKGRKTKDYSNIIKKRKEEWNNVKLLTPPKMLMWGMAIKASSKKDGDDMDELKGVAASVGEVTAVATVVNGPEDFSKMKIGSVLVAPLTTPAWTSIFSRASAIVTDVGGALSHGSIVAREFSIPAVMGTKMATKIINDGQLITVDGTKGKVYLKVKTK